MHYSLATAVTVTLAGLSVAGPVTPQKKAFSVKQVATGEKPKPAGAIAMMSTYKKYGKVANAPSKVKKAAAAASQSGTVAANPQAYDMAYLSPVTVGGQTLNLDFDTGSADLWVYSTQLSASAQSGHSVYNTSTGTLKSGYTWDITYGDGSGASGIVYSDKVVVGAVTATAQAVEAATSVSDAFLSDTDNDGLLGLAFSSINTVSPTQQTTFFDTVSSSLAAKLFTVDLKKGAAGSYDFGFIDTSKYTGAITYVNVNTANGFWQFNAGGYKVGANVKVTTQIGTSIADTGTTLLYLPSGLVSAYWKKVKGASSSSKFGGWIFPCSSTLPNLTLFIAGKPFTVPGSYLNYAPISNTVCFGGLQSNSGIGFSIFGDIFLKAVFAVFDQTQSTPRLGFAAQS